MSRSAYEVRLLAYLRAADPPLPRWEEEWTFARQDLGRGWRFDVAWPELRVAAEVDGGGRQVRWQTNPRTGRAQPVAVGRHGTTADYEKMNAAALLGWRVLRFTPAMLPNAVPIIRSVLNACVPCPACAAPDR